jgi:phosphotransacetylase
MNDLALKLKQCVISQLTKNEQIADDKYLLKGNKSYTRRDIAKEIEDETEFGVEFLSGMIMLSIDLTARGKK